MPSSSDNKKVLLIAYHFPPDRAVGALRPQKFTKYLPEFGWQPFVLTVKEKFAEKVDNSRVSDVGDALISRSEYFRSPLQTFFDVRDRWLKRGASVTNNVEHRDELFVEKPRKGLTRNIVHLIHWLNWLPDERMYWILPALLKGYRLIRKHNIRYIYATSPPHSSDIVGALLAKISGAHFVVDLRDPWACGNKRYDFSPALVVDALLERLVLNCASKVITTTEEYAAVLAASHKFPPSRYTTIYNGFDSADFAGLIRGRNDHRFVCTYLGNFYLQRSPIAFLSAARDLLDEKPELVERLLIRFVGTQRYLNGTSLQALVDEKGLQQNVTLEKAVTYRESLQHMLDSDVLLLFAPDQPLQIPAKTFEYMASKRPILALTGEGATASLILNNKAGVIAPQNDPERIKEALLEIYDKCSAGHTFYSDAETTQFDRKRQSRQLAQLLDSL